MHCIRFWLMTILISPFYRTCFLKVMNALKPLYCLTQFLRRSSIKQHLLQCYFWIFPKQTVEFFHTVSHHILLQVAKAAGLPLSIANYLQHLYLYNWRMFLNVDKELDKTNHSPFPSSLWPSITFFEEQRERLSSISMQSTLVHSVLLCHLLVTAYIFAPQI